MSDNHQTDELVKHASVIRFAAEAEAEDWSARVQYARETESAAQEFCAARSERTALILLGRALATYREAPNTMGCDHLVWAAAAHIAESNHPMAQGLAAVPPFSGRSAAEGRATVNAVIQIWNTWMETQTDPERSAEDLRNMDETEVREM